MPATRSSARFIASLAAAPLAHVTLEYPNKLDHVLGSARDVRSPRELHPVFFGSFDWHSCVHGWWTMFTALRLHPQGSHAPAIRALADEILTPTHVAGELDYLRRPESAGFERPYGWAWLLMLAAELHRHRTPDAGRWADALSPLTQAFVERFRRFLPGSPYPVRAGVHTNTAFALRLALEYAETAGDDGFFDLCRAKALEWYGDDRQDAVREPSQDDFLSPTLIEAECMRRALRPDAFAAWFDAFLPSLDAAPALLVPPSVTDRTDGKIGHLDGLSLSRAWCWKQLAGAMPAEDPRRAPALQAAERHLDAALPHMDDDYMGQHWLASFALLALADGREVAA